MADILKIPILLADEDALRRDGLAAVLQGTAKFEVVSQCADGEIALNQVRQLRPAVAVVDLNIPKIHGIELVRRIRSENLGTKVVILSGSTDDDIIREVVRAGGDAYLLKNGPARHLIDAISYVCDGGQYFSPQLRRGGLDRHLLEETPRSTLETPRSSLETPRSSQETLRGSQETPRGRQETPRSSSPPAADLKADRQEEDEVQPDRGVEARAAQENRYGRPRRPAGRRTADPARLRERLREDGEGGDFEDRDYEILGMMADGIRPILDRLDDIEGRISGMETGVEPVPSDPRGWLSTQMTETFRDRAGGRDLAPGRTIQDLEARLPKLIEEAVTSRFHSLAEKLQHEIEDTHVRTLETFVKNIQVKLVQRVAALETDMSKQAEAMHELREYSQRTEDNLSRLITGVDRLAQELPKRLLAAAPLPEESPMPAADVRTRRRSSRFSPRVFWMVVAGLTVAAGVGIGVLKRDTLASVVSPGTTAAPVATADAAPPVNLPVNADVKSKLEAAQEYADRKQYSTAEDIYKQVLKAEPNNSEAMKALASVLYREDKIEDSAAILDKLK